MSRTGAFSFQEEKTETSDDYQNNESNKSIQFAVLNKYVPIVSAELKENNVNFTFAEGYTDYLTFFVIKAADNFQCENVLKEINVKNLFGLSEEELKPIAEAAYQEASQNTLQQDETEPAPPPESRLSLGIELTIDRRRFSVDSINEEYGEVSLRDITFQNGVGFPIFRKESIDFVLMYLNEPDEEQAPQQRPASTPRTRRGSASGNSEQQSLFDLTGDATEERQPRQSNPRRDGSDVFFPGEIVIVRDHIPQPEETAEKEQSIDTEDINLWDENAPTAIRTEEKPQPPASTGRTATPSNISLPKPPNYRISTEDGIGIGGAKTKYKNNIEAIRLLQTIKRENRYATSEEQPILARYAGWGGISQAFKANMPE